MRRSTACNKCNKFSHCNNNDLICVERYDKLWTALQIIKNHCTTTEGTFAQYACQENPYASGRIETAEEVLQIIKDWIGEYV